MQTINTIVSNIDVVARVPQTLAQVCRKLDFVFDEQNFHGEIV